MSNDAKPDTLGTSKYQPTWRELHRSWQGPRMLSPLCRPKTFPAFLALASPDGCVCRFTFFGVRSASVGLPVLIEEQVGPWPIEGRAKCFRLRPIFFDLIYNSNERKSILPQEKQPQPENNLPCQCMGAPKPIYMTHIQLKKVSN